MCYLQLPVETKKEICDLKCKGDGKRTKKLNFGTGASIQFNSVQLLSCIRLFATP